MDNINRFVEIFTENYNRLMGEDRKIDKPVIESIAAAMIDLLDQRDQDKPLTEKVPLTFNTFQNHYHPQSDQILRAVGNVVTIESRDDAIARQQSVRWEPAKDTSPRPDHYKVKDVELERMSFVEKYRTVLDIKDVEVTTTISHPDGCCMGRVPRSQGT
jgi:hypothetical protein